MASLFLFVAILFVTVAHGECDIDFGYSITFSELWDCVSVSTDEYDCGNNENSRPWVDSDCGCGCRPGCVEVGDTIISGDSKLCGLLSASIDCPDPDGWEIWSRKDCGCGCRRKESNDGYSSAFSDDYVPPNTDTCPSSDDDSYTICTEDWLCEAIDVQCNNPGEEEWIISGCGCGCTQEADVPTPEPSDQTTDSPTREPTESNDDDDDDYWFTDEPIFDALSVKELEEIPTTDINIIDDQDTDTDSDCVPDGGYLLGHNEYFCGLMNGMCPGGCESWTADCGCGCICDEESESVSSENVYSDITAAFSSVPNVQDIFGDDNFFTSTDFDLESTLLDGNDVILGEDIEPITMPRFKHSNMNLSEKMISDAFKRAAFFTIAALAFLCVLMLIYFGCLRRKLDKSVEVFNGENEKIAEHSDDDTDDETASDDDERGILRN